jgi:hypothetical protein
MYGLRLVLLVNICVFLVMFNSVHLLLDTAKTEAWIYDINYVGLYFSHIR